ncbi:HTH_Tnp_Tc3_2 domain-containing protein [Trichonephila clavipes]|nr:HTH_Tnp_Tc3_2 domain-containing protein [Trichonephila clavipes]
MVKISVALRFRIPFNDRKNASPQDSSSLSANIRVEVVSLDSKRQVGQIGKIARLMGRSDVAFRRYWQECINNGRFQHHDGTGRPRATADWEDRLIVRSDVTEPDSSLSTIRRVNRTRVSTMTIDRQLIERNLRSYRPLHHFPLLPAHCRTR